MALNKPGFSLIELIVVIGLLSLLMLAISSTMLMTIVSSNRIRTSAKVKQAGNYAIGQMQSLLRSAKTVISCTSPESIVFINYDGGQTELLAQADANNLTRIASNSGTYLTPDNLSTTNFSLTCEPSDADPSLVKISFDLEDTVATRELENPLLHFETSVSLRNQ